MATRDELIDAIMLDTGIKTKTTAEKAFDALLNGIISGLQEDGEVQLTFGKFKKVHRNARMGRNPQTGESIEIPAKTVVKFYASKSFKEEMQDPDVENEE
jgi:DNA-binding protein HU-beta